MAETKTTNNAKKATVRLPRLNGKNAVQEEFFSVNGKNYIIKRGETVEIPPEVEEVIRNGEKAEDYALSYTDKLRDNVAAKDAAYGINK
jgi:hypothetical protein